MNSIKRILRPLSSVTLAVVLMLAAMLLVYAGTLAQISADNWIVQKRFFASWLVWIGLNDLVPHRYGVSYGPGFLPIPGGFALGVMLLVNLVAAHLVQFKFTWRRTGVILIHFSLIVLLVGEGIRASMTHEAVMAIPRWAAANYTDDDRHFELAVVDPSPAGHDSVVVIPNSMLRSGAVIKDPKLPFEIRIDEFYKNSMFVHPGLTADNPHAGVSADSIGFREVRPRQREGDAPDRPSACLTINVPDQEPAKFWASMWTGPRSISVDGKAYVLDLRYKRSYRPYTLFLLKLSHDLYAGSDRPRNFSSRVRLFDPQHNEDRDTLIWMNHPLRYRGETFYQFQTLQNDSGTVLQVVDNPGWMLPYVACTIGGLGMLFHFGLSLLGFVRDRSKTAGLPVHGGGSYTLPSRPTFWDPAVLVPAAVVVVCAAFMLWLARPLAPTASGFDLNEFGSIPVLFDGRPQPTETLARNSLRVISSRESFKTDDGRRVSALQWLLDVMTDKPQIDDYRVFRIDSPDVIHLLDLDPTQKFFSARQILAKREAFEKAATAAFRVQSADRDSFQRSIVELDNKLGLYQLLRTGDPTKLRVVPPLARGEEWKSLRDSAAAARSPLADPFEAIVRAYVDDRPADFNRAVAEYAALLRKKAPSVAPAMPPTTAPSTAPASFDFAAFGRLPVSFGGVQTLDQFARNALRGICGAESYELNGQRLTAIQWLLEMFAERGQDDPVFRISDPTLRQQLELPPDRETFAPLELANRIPRLQQAFADTKHTPEAQRTPYQRAVAELENKLGLYNLIASWQMQLPLSPPMGGQTDWQPLVRFQPTFAAEAVISVFDSYRTGQASDFNHYVRSYQRLLDDSSSLDATMRKIHVETLLNRFDPFWYGILGYLIAFVLACCSWLFWSKPLARAAVAMILFVLVFHTLGLAARVYIQGRPPVTNLYSSAIFIAWGAVVLAIVLECIFRNGIGSVCAAAIGAVSLIVAHYLAVDEGDTMKPLQAVLDTNIWLATHVICITLGYASAFLAGFLAVIYVIRGVFTRSLDRTSGRDLIRAIYGIACFATLFSFVGTILGGIWADQSWGRFWGWDPKENGAALLVLWNAIILHARWRGLLKDRGFAMLAIAGNIVTAWSWFGTNMLGVGLHSYGFMDKALVWLLFFNITQLVLIAIAAMPRHLWASEE